MTTMTNDDINAYLEDNLAEVPVGFRWEVRADGSKARKEDSTLAFVSLVLSRKTIDNWNMYILRGGRAAVESFDFNWDDFSEEMVLDKLVEMSHELITDLNFNEYQMGFQQAITGAYKETV